MQPTFRPAGSNHNVHQRGSALVIVTLQQTLMEPPKKTVSLCPNLLRTRMPNPSDEVVPKIGASDLEVRGPRGLPEIHGPGGPLQVEDRDEHAAIGPRTQCHLSAGVF
eukprot:6019461-Pyramimonas_sp.AAC.1